MSIGFIDYICMPLFSVLRKFHANLQDFMENLKSNRAQWTEETDVKVLVKTVTLGASISVARNNRDVAPKILNNASFVSLAPLKMKSRASTAAASRHRTLPPVYDLTAAFQPQARVS